MINIKPVSDLRNYNKLLSDVKANNPLFLTKKMVEENMRSLI